jgi:hypothetical protein
LAPVRINGKPAYQQKRFTSIVAKSNPFTITSDLQKPGDRKYSSRHYRFTALFVADHYRQCCGQMPHENAMGGN